MRSGVLPIGEVARRAGLRPSAVRYYQAVGLLPLPSASGKRRHDASALRRLAAIRVAREAGFTVSEIRALVHGAGLGPDAPPSARWAALAHGKLAEMDARIRRAEAR